MLSKVLNNSALLGTDRRKIDVNELHPEISKRINPETTQEQILLDSLSYDYFRNLQCRLPDSMEKVVIPEMIKEERPYVSFGLSTLILDVLSEKQYISRPMTLEILQFVSDKQKILRPESVIQLLKKKFGNHKQINALTSEVIGERGKKLLELFPQLSLTLTETKSSSWEEGSAAERLIKFKTWRNSDTKDGISELKADWDSESIRAKLGFLKVTNQTLKERDGDFLSSIYLKEFADKKIKRKTDKECKKMLISSLTRLNRISILDELESQLQLYLQDVTKAKAGKASKKGPGRTKKKFKSIKKTDDFWNGTYLSEWLGLSEKNLDLARFDFDPLYWLGEMIEILPFDFWCRLLDCDTTAAVHYFLTDKPFQVKITDEKEPIFISALIRNAQSTKDVDLLEALSTSPYYEEDSGPLVALFSDQQFETYITQNKLWAELPLINNRLKVLQQPWSKEFSETFLKEVQLAVSKNECYPDHNFGSALTGAINSEALPYLKKIHDKVLNEPWFPTWNMGLIKPIIRKMNLTDRFNKLKKEENEQT